MKIERTKNAARNIIFGILLKAYQIIVPFLMRTAIIYFMGVQYLGLSSLFISILQVLNLVELGVGSAMVYSMYEPIVKDDSVRICALMQLYRKYYHIIGGVIAVIGLCLTPFVPNLIKGDLPAEINVYILYLLNLLATVLSYWLFAYKNALFQAHQRVDVTSKITLVTTTVQYVLQLIVIVFIKDYYLYVIIMLLTQALTNLLTAFCATRMYPNYVPKGKLDNQEVKKINRRIRDLFTSKIGGVVVNSADTIVISAYLGLTMLAVYQNYYYILSSVIGLVAVVFNACTAGIGNSVIVETKKKNYHDLQKFTFLISWIAGCCACCFLCLYQPFMRIWMGEKLMLRFPAVICFCLYYFIYEVNQLLNTYKDAAGIWHEDRFRPLVTAIVNVTLNLISVRFLGIYGVLLSTVLSMLFVGMPWLLHNLFTVLFDKEQLPGYLRSLVKYIVVVLFSCTICYLICQLFSFGEWETLFFRFAVCLVLSNAIYFSIYRKNVEFEQCVRLLDNVTKGRLHLIKYILRR
mgnify:CR=1 FL=1